MDVCRYNTGEMAIKSFFSFSLEISSEVAVKNQDQMCDTREINESDVRVCWCVDVFVCWAFPRQSNPSEIIRKSN